MSRSFVHRLQQPFQRFRKSIVAFRAAKTARLFEIRLREAAARAFYFRAAARLLDFLRSSQAEQQIRQRETRRVIHALRLGALFAEVNLLHFIPGDLG